MLNFVQDEGLLVTWNFIKNAEELRKFNEELPRNILSVVFSRFGLLQA